MARCVEKWEAVSSRVGVLRLRGTPVRVSVVIAYAPVEDAQDAKKDEFRTGRRVSLVSGR